ncbi:nicotinamidase [Massilia sp. YIM B02769]|jgi:nicotinamidase/pyrazinamidase|uniref:nicotinamidase n=1 Tax=Massilia sp. YIM B02769 TaxID=3050129 RepID=UPI0025B6E3A4|nr:nicotinamidase [Massilia sp. YIM B02769]MDN4059228.1 nicotinamidase [Massilia sp. YIM B02769]
MNPIRLQDSDALLVIDMQYDFLPGGSLGVPEGDQVLAPINEAMARFAARGLPVYASRDWHPEDHCSFAARGGPWPPHCVAETRGAAFSDELALPADTVIISKADTADVDAYSAFNGTALADHLRGHGITRVFVCGLATDYCVLNTALDALKNGFETVILPEAMRAVNVQPEDGERAIAQMREAGATAATLAELEQEAAAA